MRIILICLFMLLDFGLRGQSNTFCINAFACLINNDSVFAGVSIGEPVITTIKSADYILNQGLLQTEIENSFDFKIKNTDKSIRIYPNPFSDEIQIFSEFELAEYRLYDVYGKLIETKGFVPVLELGYLPPASYQLVLLSATKEIIYTFKLLKIY